VSEVLHAESHESARDEAIRAFLRSHPDFLKDDPPLLAELGLRPHAANVIDFGPKALSRVAAQHRRETSERLRLEAVARANYEAQSQTHEAVVELIGARHHTDLAQRLDAFARARFALAACVIALEGPDRVPAGWRPLAEGQVDQIIGDGRPARLGAAPTAMGLFASGVGQVGSVALIRLSLWSPERVGVLAFGAADETHFSPDMGHELIDFLARVVERTAERWPAL
jgi:uncharacterized protein YigA (DUF484 family)